MPFRVTDNVSCWFYGLLEEEFDSLDEEEQGSFLERTKNLVEFKEYLEFYAANYLAERVKRGAELSEWERSQEKLFAESILNSLNFEFIRKQIKSYAKFSIKCAQEERAAEESSRG